MRQRSTQPQTNWQYPPTFRAGATGSSGASGTPIGLTYSATGPLAVGVTTGTTTYLDLTSISGPPTKASVPQGMDDWSPNPTGHRIFMQPDGDNVYVAFGDAPATIGTLSATITTAIDGGTITGSTGKAAAAFTQTGSTASAAMKLINGTVYGPFEIPVGPPPGTTSGLPGQNDNVDQAGGRYSAMRYLGFVAGTTSAGVILRIWTGSD